MSYYCFFGETYLYSSRPFCTSLAGHTVSRASMSFGVGLVPSAHMPPRGRQTQLWTQSRTIHTKPKHGNSRSPRTQLTIRLVHLITLIMATTIPQLQAHCLPHTHRIPPANLLSHENDVPSLIVQFLSDLLVVVLISSLFLLWTMQ